ncbi:MAG: cytochrome P450 [Pseudomonadota bacterium]|jgi:cytochrome P450
MTASPQRPDHAPQDGHSTGQPPFVSSSALESDPHTVFRYWRARTPVIQREDGACLVLRAADVDTLLTDDRTRQIDGGLYSRIRGVPPGPLQDLLVESLLMSEGDAHQRRRAPMSRVLAFHAVESLRDTIRSAAERLIDDVEAGARFDGEIDLMAAFCAPFPPLVMSRLLGAPPSEAEAFAQWVYQVSPAFAPALPGEDMASMVEGAGRLTAYVQQGLAKAMAGEGARSELMENMVAAIGADALTQAEAVAQLATLIIGASDTTRTAIAILTGLMLATGQAWKRVGDDPSLARAAVAEALRVQPAVGSVPRLATQEIVLDGAIIPAGRLVSLSTLSAMRDPARFSDPDAFIINRTDHPRWPLVFGGGAHRCIGEALARLELEEGLMALSRRLPSLRLAGPPPKIEGYAGIRRIDGLRVAL